MTGTYASMLLWVSDNLRLLSEYGMINQAPGFIRKNQKHTKTRKLEHQKLNNIKREREKL